MEYLWLILGFVLLIKGADLFVDGSISVARRLNIPSLIIGLTIVAMGTSAPEASVSISASIRGVNEIAVGNIIGSNIFNLLVVVGVCAVIKPVNTEKRFLFSDYLIALFAAGLLIVLSWGNMTEENALTSNIGRISLTDGIIFLLFMIAFISYTVIMAKRSDRNDSEEYEKMSILKTVIYLTAGLGCVIYGGQMVVDSSKTIASSFGLSDSLIGLTIVAIGTSLPELVTSIVAAGKGESDIALGNVIGSNIFNTFFILGMTASVGYIPINGFTVIDAVISFVLTALVLFMAIPKFKINRFCGAFMIFLYIAFTAYLIWRQINFAV